MISLRPHSFCCSHDFLYRFPSNCFTFYRLPPTHSPTRCPPFSTAIHRDTYGRIPELRSQHVKAGGVAVLPDNERRFIYYLVSKTDTYTQPTYPDLTDSLRAMKDHMVIMGRIRPTKGSNGAIPLGGLIPAFDDCEPANKFCGDYSP